MEAISQREKRLEVRRHWRGKIVLEDEFGEGLMYLFSRDISLGGLFLENPPPLKLGAQLFLSFTFPGAGKPIRLTGQVVRFLEPAEQAKGQAGAGVRFVDVDSESRRLISEFIQKDISPIKNN